MCLCLSVCPLVYLCCFITVFCIRANKESYLAPLFGVILFEFMEKLYGS